MRVTHDRLYDSEATLRLVDRVLDELDMTDPFRPAAPRAAGYRTEQLRAEPLGTDAASSRFLRAFWEIHDALELLRDSHAALRPSLEAAEANDDQHDRLDRALAMVDQLQGEGRDAEQERTHGALRTELLALADHLRSREAVTDRLHLTADLLLDLEGRLAQLAQLLEGTGKRD